MTYAQAYLLIAVTITLCQYPSRPFIFVFFPAALPESHDTVGEATPCATFERMI